MHLMFGLENLDERPQKPLLFIPPPLYFSFPSSFPLYAMTISRLDIILFNNQQMQ